MDQLVAKRLGKIIKEERNNQNVSIRALAEYCGISHTSLAEIENGEKLPSEEICENICSELDIANNIYSQTKKKEDIKNKFDVFFDFVYFQDMDNADQFYQDLLLIEKREELNLFEIDFELIKLIFYISSNKAFKSIMKTIDKLEMNQQLFYPAEIVLYYLYKAAYYTDINLLAKAEDLLIKAMKLTDNEKYLSLIYAQLGMVYTKNNETALAIKFYIDAKKIFDDNMNYVRSLYACSNIAIAYIYSESYMEAIKACKECMTIAERLSLKKVIMVNAYNLSYIYMLIEQYEKVNENVLICLKNGEPENGIYFHNAYAYYKMNEIQSSNYWIEEGRSKLLKSEVCMSYLYDYLESQIEHNYKQSIEILEKVINSDYYDESFDNQDRRFILREFMEVCKIEQRYDLIAEYYSEL